eukprot:scaffold4990_cov387-Prasinococcus_capsulatus_cf.AAC.21
MAAKGKDNGGKALVPTKGFQGELCANRLAHRQREGLGNTLIIRECATVGQQYQVSALQKAGIATAAIAARVNHA